MIFKIVVFIISCVVTNQGSHMLPKLNNARERRLFVIPVVQNPKAFEKSKLLLDHDLVQVNNSEPVIAKVKEKRQNGYTKFAHEDLNNILAYGAFPGLTSELQATKNRMIRDPIYKKMFKQGVLNLKDFSRRQNFIDDYEQEIGKLGNSPRQLGNNVREDFGDELLELEGRLNKTGKWKEFENLAVKLEKEKKDWPFTAQKLAKFSKDLQNEIDGKKEAMRTKASEETAKPAYSIQPSPGMESYWSDPLKVGKPGNPVVEKKVEKIPPNSVFKMAMPKLLRFAQSDPEMLKNPKVQEMIRTVPGFKEKKKKRNKGQAVSQFQNQIGVSQGQLNPMPQNQLDQLRGPANSMYQNRISQRQSETDYAYDMNMPPPGRPAYPEYGDDPRNQPYGPANAFNQYDQKQLQGQQNPLYQNQLPQPYQGQFFQNGMHQPVGPSNLVNANQKEYSNLINQNQYPQAPPSPYTNYQNQLNLNNQNGPSNLQTKTNPLSQFPTRNPQDHRKIQKEEQQVEDAIEGEFEMGNSIMPSSPSLRANQQVIQDVPNPFAKVGPGEFPSIGSLGPYPYTALKPNYNSRYIRTELDGPVENSPGPLVPMPTSRR